MAGRHAFVVVGVVSALAGRAQAQVRTGGEFTINTAFDADPIAPAVSFGGDTPVRSPRTFMAKEFV